MATSDVYCQFCRTTHASWYRCNGVPPQATLKPTGRKGPPLGPECACGRLVQAEGIRTLQQSSHRFVFYRCDCGLEWTDEWESIDRASPVCADEVIAVHEVLLAWDGTVSQLLEERK